LLDKLLKNIIENNDEDIMAKYRTVKKENKLVFGSITKHSTAGKNLMELVGFTS